MSVHLLDMGQWMKAAPKLWSEIAKAQPVNPPTVTVDHLMKALAEVAECDREQELRSRGMVVYRLPESEKSSALERKTEDRSAIKDLLDFISCQDAEVTYIERLGRYDKDRADDHKYRPVKVRFNNNASRDKVLRNLNKLRNAPDAIRTLGIRQDLNEQQRKELRDIMEEAREKTKASSSTFYRVKGEPGNYRLIEVPKKS